MSSSTVLQGKPTYNVPCGSCHGTSRNAMSITAHDTTTDLGQGNVKTFTVEAGATAHLSVDVINGSDRYGAVIYDLEDGGVQNSSNHLAYIADSSWADFTSKNPPYYCITSSSSGVSWGGTTQTYTFDLQVDAVTPTDYYQLTFEVAGTGGGRWSEHEAFYLHVLPGAPQPGDGDINDDGAWDLYDFALLAGRWFENGCTEGNQFCGGADVNVDGQVDAADLWEIASRWLLRPPLAIQVGSGNDDAEESVADGSMDLISTDLELIDDAGAQIVGMRFAGVGLRQGDSVAEAYIQFTVDEVSTGTCSLTIVGQTVDDAASFTTASGNISSRAETTQTVGWTPADWNTVGQASDQQRTPNIAPIINEIINRPGWSAGNAIAIMITGTGKRTAESYDGDAAAAPVLHIIP